MNYKDWTTLKTAGKVAFKKVAAVVEVVEVRDDDNNITTAGVSSQKAYTVLEKKTYNPDTGAESTVEERLSLGELERQKAQLTAEKTKITAELTEVGKMITAIKKV